MYIQYVYTSSLVHWNVYIHRAAHLTDTHPISSLVECLRKSEHSSSYIGLDNGHVDIQRTEQT